LASVPECGNSGQPIIHHCMELVKMRGWPSNISHWPK